MSRIPAVVGDSWSFSLARLSAGGVPLTSTTAGLTIQCSVVLDNTPWGGPFTPTYDAGTNRWVFQLELPGPGNVAVRWYITYGLLTKTIEQSVYVEARGPQVSVAGQSNLDWDVGPQGPPGGGSTVVIKQSDVVLGVVDTIDFVSGSSVTIGGGEANVAIVAGTGAVWGNITGTLSNQTDLQTALNLKAPLASPTFTGTVSGITKTMVGLGNVDNTSDASKPISTATQTALDGKAPVGAKYIVQQADATLTAEQSLGALPTGVLKSTTTTGLLSIAVPGTDFETAGATATHAALTGTAVHGLGTMSTQAASAVAITGGSVTGITDITVADGGTGASTALAARSNLGLVIGTDVQAQDAELAAIAGLVSAADRLPYFTGLGTATLATFTAAGRAIVDDADASAQLTTLGVSTFIKTLLDDADAATARTTLGVGSGSGDVVGPAASVDSEGVLFSGTTGKLLKRSTFTGILKETSGVQSVATAGTDYYNPGGTDVAVADGGTGASTAASALTNLGAAPTVSPTFTGTVTLPANQTLVTPTIASFTNATHPHTNAAGGGQLTAAALSAFDISDSLFRVVDNTDATKKLAIEVSGITTGTTRTLTPPNFDGTIATLAGTETLSGKTLTTPTISATGFINANHAHAAANSGGTLDAAAIATGTMATARLGSGTPSGTTFLRGDSTWATPTATATPAGSDTHLQYNNAGAMGAIAELAFNKSTTSPVLSIGANTTSTLPALVLNGASGAEPGIRFQTAGANTWGIFRLNNNDFSLWNYTTAATAFTIDDATSLATFAGTVQGAVRDTGGQVFNVKAYGAIGDGSSHPLSGFFGTLAAAQAVYPRATALTQQIDYHAIQRTIDLAGSWSTIYVPPGRYQIDATVQVGGVVVIGTDTSTVQGQKLIGAGAGFMSNAFTSIAPSRGATTFDWVGADGGTMVYVQGPISGVTIEGFLLSCFPAGSGNRAANGLWTAHIMHSQIRKIHVDSWGSAGLLMTAYPNPTNVNQGSSGNHIDQFSTGGSPITTAAAMVIGSTDTGASPQHDVCVNLFTNCVCNVSDPVSSIGLHLRYCDNNTFVQCGWAAGTTGGGLRRTSPTGTNGTNWPAGNRFIGCWFMNAETGDTPIGGKDTFWSTIMGDSGVQPTKNSVWITSEGDMRMTSLGFGTVPALAGTIRMPQLGSVVGRNAANSADITMLQMGSDNGVHLGSGAVGVVLDTPLYANGGFNAVDANLAISATGDGTKVGRFNSAGISPSTTRVLDFPNHNGLITPLAGEAIIQSDFTLAAASGVQAAFPTANDVLTLNASTTYHFECWYWITTGATSHTTATAFAFSSAPTAITYVAEILSGASVAILTGSWSKSVVTAAGSTILNAAATLANTLIRLRGTIRTNGATTITPQIDFSANPTGTNLMKRDSYFRCWPIGSNTVAAIGPWA